MQTIGFCFLALGIILFLTRFLPSRKTVVTADRGGVAIGGDNHGNINTGTIGSGNSPGGSNGLRLFDIIAGLCSITGLILVLWPVNK